MKYISYYISNFLIVLIVLTGCDIEGEKDRAIVGYKRVSAKIEWQSDAQTKYKVKLDGKDTTSLLLPFEQEKVKLQVYKDDDTTAELEKDIILRLGETKINLIQFPKSKIQIVKATKEKDPKNKYHIKVRFFYNDDMKKWGWGDKVKIDIYATRNIFSKKTKQVASIIAEKGKISDYLELDLNVLNSDPKNRRILNFYFNATDVTTNKLLVNHLQKRRRLRGREGGISLPLFNVYDKSGILLKGFSSHSKFVTLQANVRVTSRFSYTYFKRVFSTPWKKK